MGFGPNILGHSPDVVIDAVRETIGHGTSLAIGTPLEVELAQMIARLVPSMEQMRFVTTGTEATMMALRTARAFTGRSRIARFEGHYHGQHDTALVSVAHVAGSEHDPEPAADGAGIPASVLDEVVVLPWNDIDVTAPVVRREAGELAAIILEPVPFSNIGGEEPDHEFMRSLRELTWERGILLIFDEVITGFRLALGGAAAHFGFAPDLHVFGKTVGGGFPIGIYGGRRDVMEAVVTPRGGDPHSADDDLPVGDVLRLAAVDAGGPRHARPDRADGRARGRGRTRRGDPRRLAGDRRRPRPAGAGHWLSSWFGLFFTDRPIRTRRDAMTADPERQRAFSLGLLAGGVYMTPSHPGFTSAAHTEADIQHVLEVSERVLREIKATT